MSVSPNAANSTEPRFESAETAWRERAECARLGVPPSLFFADGTNERAVATARWVCAHCPVQEPCLDYALRSGSDGFWAGTTRAQRRRLVRSGPEATLSA